MKYKLRNKIVKSRIGDFVLVNGEEKNRVLERIYELYKMTYEKVGLKLWDTKEDLMRETLYVAYNEKQDPIAAFSGKYYEVRIGRRKIAFFKVKKIMHDWMEGKKKILEFYRNFNKYEGFVVESSGKPAAIRYKYGNKIVPKEIAVKILKAMSKEVYQGNDEKIIEEAIREGKLPDIDEIKKNAYVRIKRINGEEKYIVKVMFGSPVVLEEVPSEKIKDFKGYEVVAPPVRMDAIY